MDYFKQWAERKFGLAPRVTASLLAGIVFVILIPTLIIKGSQALEGWLGVSKLDAGIVNYCIGGGVVVTGWLLAIWSIVAQLIHGSGTPLPMMATQKLLTSGPFAYCRNPMSLGTILAYFGIAIWIGSFFAAGIVAVLSALLIIYLITIEDKELEMLFGQAYINYKRTTPFLLPNFRRNKNRITRP